MKILNVLVAESAMTAYRDISDTQTIVLMRVAAGKVAYETAHPREQAVMDELVDLGLLTDLSYEVTPKGASVASMAQKRGPRDARLVQQRNDKAGLTQKPFDANRRYTDRGDAGDAIEPGDDMVSTSQGARSIDRGNIV